MVKKAIDESSSTLLCGWQCQAVQIVLSTLPLFGFLLYFLLEAFRRPSKPIYNIDWDADADTIQQAVDDTGEIIPLSYMINTFLIVAVFATCIAAYMSIYVTFHRSLVEKYLRSGKRITGDVYYRDRGICLPKHQGFAVYPHPAHDTYPVSIRKQVLVHERFTRERVKILILPDEPFSGQSKSDLKLELIRIQRNSKKTDFITWYSWCWVVFTLASPVYILVAMDNLFKDPDLYYDEFVEDSDRAWTVYFCCAVFIPVFTTLLVWVIWSVHRYTLVRGDATFLAEGESKTSASWYEASSSDDEMLGYAPPRSPPPPRAPEASRPTTPAGSLTTIQRNISSVYLT
jgi:hypothetical protein